MQNKELHKLGKTDLLTIIYEQQKEIENLKHNIEDLEKKLSDKTINLQNAGSIAEASLRINKIFESAQEAADLYLKSIKEVSNLEQPEIAEKKDVYQEIQSKYNDANIIDEQVSLYGSKYLPIKTEGEKSLIDTNEKKSQISPENKPKIENMLIPIYRDLTIIKPTLVQRLMKFLQKMRKLMCLIFLFIKRSIVGFTKLILKALVLIVKFIKKLFKIIKELYKKIYKKIDKKIYKIQEKRKERKLKKALQYWKKPKFKDRLKKIIKAIKKRIQIQKEKKKEKRERKKYKREKNKEKQKPQKEKRIKNKESKTKKKEQSNEKFTLSLEEIEAELAKRKKSDAKRTFLKTFIFACLIIIAIAIITATIFFKTLQVNGSSMEPNLVDGQILITSKFFKYDKGDMIAFYYNDKVLIKRVIAKEGETVYIDDTGNVFVNNVKLTEKYVDELDYGNCNITFPYIVPENSVFILGDNRKVSMDSRNSSIGCISNDNIIGKIKFRLNPLTFY